MKPPKCLPFYHPTRVVFVDDDPAFLNLLPLRLGELVPFLRFDSPRELLLEFAAGRLQARLDLDWWDAYPSEVGQDLAEQVVAFDKTMIALRVLNRARFGLVSVLVADYQMPEMTGLELFHALGDLPCKRILLTGQADESLAVQAFNEGLIDLYLPKLHPRLDQELNRAIERFQYAYLEQATDLITQVLQAADPTVWGDPVFARFFHRVCQERGVVEYYAVADPKGYWLLKVDGQPEVMLLFSDGEIDAQATAAAASRAPDGVVSRLRRRRSALYFPDSGDRALSQAQWWRACVPVHPLLGQTDRFYALIRNPEPLLLAPDRVMGLRHYLDHSN
jgi:CheY-like chemotaxis protein/catechol 2,3-dioxygenase-like lactoylglutathione lyase family enzyme